MGVKQLWQHKLTFYEPTCSFVHDLLVYLQSKRDGVVIGFISLITLDNNLFENWSHKLSHKLDRNQSKNGMQDVYSLCPFVTKKHCMLKSHFDSAKESPGIRSGKIVKKFMTFFSSRFRQNMISDQLSFDEKVLILSKRGCGLVAYL